VVVAFGLGVATGFVLVSLLTDSHSSRDQNMAHRLGKHLLDAMSSVLPETLSRSIHK
jgi:hypothetical protein